MQGRSQGGSWGPRDSPFCKPFLTKQPSTGGENAMTISGQTFFKSQTWRGGRHDNLVSSLILTQCDQPLKNRGYAYAMAASVWVPVLNLFQSSVNG